MEHPTTNANAVNILYKRWQKDREQIIGTSSRHFLPVIMIIMDKISSNNFFFYFFFKLDNTADTNNTTCIKTKPNFSLIKIMKWRDRFKCEDSIFYRPSCSHCLTVKAARCLSDFHEAKKDTGSNLTENVPFISKPTCFELPIDWWS